MTNGAVGGWDQNPRWDQGGQWNQDTRWNQGAGPQPPPQQQWNDYAPEPGRAPSRGAVLAMVMLAVLVLALLGAVAYLLLRPGGTAGGGTGQAAATSSASPGSAPQPPVTRTAGSTPPGRETVTVTRPAPEPAPEPQSGSYPVGADRSGWTGDRAARCNAGDPAAMIGRTTQSRFSICVNPANGRYYYRGSSGGAGVEIDDPVVSDGSAAVSNADVLYSIDAGGMDIYQGGELLSSQPMLDFWSG